MTEEQFNAIVEQFRTTIKLLDEIKAQTAPLDSNLPRVYFPQPYPPPTYTVTSTEGPGATLVDGKLIPNKPKRKGKK